MEEVGNRSQSLLEALPADIHFEILKCLPLSAQLNWRLASPYLRHSATAFVFRHVRLSAARQPTSFLSVAASDTLSQHVRHATLDIDLPLSHRGARLLKAEPSDESDVFLRALPQLNRFRGLRTLQIRFSQFCGGRGKHLRGPLEPEETNEVRYLVLDVVFHCLAGTWTAAKQARLKAHLDGGAITTAVADANMESSERPERDLVSVFDSAPEGSANEPLKPIELDTLTVINLSDANDPRLRESSAFKRILDLETLRTLKLLVTFEIPDASNVVQQHWGPAANNPRPVQPPAKYEFLASLPATWLRPSIATNLRTLMLYCGNYWGWCPKFDPRTINPQLGDGGGLPSLRVLGLGNFVFSHAWQAEWIAGLGRGAARHGLEELYLDDCPIMWQARIHGPLDQSKTTLVPMNSATESMDIDDGNGGVNPLRISNAGYPRTDIVTTSVSAELIEFENAMRWHTVLSLWRERMTGLKVFGMGSGTFDSVSAEIGTGKNRSPDDQVAASVLAVFTASAAAQPAGALSGTAPAADTYSRGMSIDRTEILQYIRYEGGFTVGPWVLRDFGQRMIRDEDGGLEAYERIRRNDEFELAALIATATTRR